ncbi:RNA polymerase sigma factor [Methylocystis echinoides]|uniref:RNA polymerase sigma factor n=1 Tax=Methylocystis echinoides TaxID=29468 RepID=UPI00249346AB|nr:sigma-70 family RNA polymerase sigma factor [Methylocystis echinoides]
MPGEDGDSDLAQRAAAGDRAAFATLAARHYDRVHALAWRWCGARAEAEDVAQETMEKMARGIRGFRGDCAFSTWAYRIAYTTAVDHLRARARIVPLAPSQMQPLAEGGADDPPEDVAMNSALWRAVRALPEQQRDAVLLVYGEDMSHAEAAATMGCAEKTVSWHVHEAKKRLKILLEALIAFAASLLGLALLAQRFGFWLGRLA